MTYSTDDCKKLLIQHYSSTKEKDWKRISKKKINNEICRTFHHSEIGDIVIVESNHGLQIRQENLTEHRISENPSIIYQKTFPANLQKIANKIILQYIGEQIYNDEGKLEKDEDSDDYIHNIEKIMDNPYLSKGFQALPSCFTFYFPDGSYGNESNNIANGIYSSMKFDDGFSHSFNVCFDFRNNDDPDCGANYLLTEGILPSWTSYADEYHLECNSDAPDMTVFDFFKMLVELGFEYKPGDMGCLFEKELNHITIKKTQPSNEKNSISFANMVSFIRKGDMTSFKQALDNGFKIEETFKSHTLFSEAINHGNFDFAQELLDRGFDLFKDVFSYSAIFGNSKNKDLTQHAVMKMALDKYEQFVLTATDSKKDNMILANVWDNILDGSHQIRQLVWSINQHLSPDILASFFLHDFRSYLFYPKEYDALLQTSSMPVIENLVSECYSEETIMYKLYQLRPVNLQHLMINNVSIIDVIKEEINHSTFMINDGFDMIYVTNGVHESQNQKYTKETRYYQWLLQQISTTSPSKSNKP